MSKTKILITVKTYPSISTKYEELVCTAGFTEDGKWIRLYPIPFRKKSYDEQYKKYEWIELDIVKNKSDFRPESYRPYSIDTHIDILGKINTGNNWQARKEIVLTNVHTNLTKLIQEAKQKNKCTSLAVFKPTEILDFTFTEEKERDWSASKVLQFRQLNFFDSGKSGFNIVRKLPYKFSYKFKDEEGRLTKLMIEDWETGQLYWNCLERYGDELIACKKVKEKYYDDFAKTKDLHFFLGTTKLNHFRSKNPFIIIGTFHPKVSSQGELF